MEIIKKKTANKLPANMVLKVARREKRKKPMKWEQKYMQWNISY